MDFDLDSFPGARDAIETVVRRAFVWATVCFGATFAAGMAVGALLIK